MRILRFVFPFLAVLSVSGHFREARGARQADGPVVCFGDSITAGYGVRPEEAYPALLADRTGGNFINAGVSGETSAAGLERMERDVLSRSPKIVIVEFGGNDFLRKVPLSKTVANVEKMIVLARGRGILVAVADLGRRPGMPDYAGEYKRLCKKYKAVFIPDLLKGIADTPGMTSDGVHPVPAGYRIIADRIYSALEPYL